MSIIIDGVTIPITGDFIDYNGTKIDKVVYNGVTVWEKQKDINAMTLTASNIYHGPDSYKVSDSITKYVYHYNLDQQNSAGSIVNYVQKSGNTIVLENRASSSAGHSSTSGSMWIDFSVDLTNIKTIEIGGSWISTVSVDRTANGSLYVKTIGSKNLTSAKQIASAENPYNSDGNVANLSKYGTVSISLDVRSCSGVHTVRLQNDFYNSSGGNTSVKFTITKFMFKA